MAVEHEVEIDEFHFVLASHGYQFNADASTAKSAHVMVDTNEFLDDDTRTRYLEALTQACRYSESFDMMTKVCEFVLSEASRNALASWEDAMLHGHALLYDAAIYAAEIYGFPLSDDLKSKLRAWNQDASQKIYG